MVFTSHSRYSGEISQTNQDLLIKTEDEFETEALDNDADDGDDTLAEQDDFISTEDFQAPPYKIEDIANEKSDDSSDIRKEFKEKTEKVERRRGPDHSWSEVANFRSQEEFDKSDEEAVRELRDMFIMSKRRTNRSGDVIYDYVCNYRRRKGYNCPYKIRLLTFSNFPEVIIERIEDVEHDHKRTDDLGQKEQFRWGRELTEYLSNCISRGHTPIRISKILEKSNFFTDGKRPTRGQLYNKIAFLRKKFGLNRSSGRSSFSSYREYREWQLERMSGRTKCEGRSEDVSTAEAEGGTDNHVIVSAETKTSVNVKAVKNWSEVGRYDSYQEFTCSDIAEELKQCTRKSRRSDRDGPIISKFVCSFSRRKGNMSCPVVYKVLEFTTSPSVVVEALEGMKHVHEKDPDYLGERVNLSFRWSEDMTNLIYEGVSQGLRPFDISKMLLGSGLFSAENIPSKVQINNKINHVARLTGQKISIKNSHGRTRGRPRIPKNRYVPYITK